MPVSSGQTKPKSGPTDWVALDYSTRALRSQTMSRRVGERKSGRSPRVVSCYWRFQGVLQPFFVV